ncbi:aminoacyl-tRNA hydrolase [Gimesia aquarii]|uniref:peptidyl-tRNA hydrolase n=1 Tax=Gimesia aquarii TaxID=2527964 RepID=A0A517WSC0_9PLAN|nr:aminoacyl-tRNA hydrolase [Gimesia aquarii]QDU08155.1 peptidyl-tRNA hydrolase [Gimesia aquarii]
MTNEWTKPEYVEAYLAHMKCIPHRTEGEATLLSEIPKETKRVLDLGCGDGHLMSLILSRCPNAIGVGLDFSTAMLEQARQRFGNSDRVMLVEHNMDDQLLDLGEFDCIVSSFAIHHCSHQRKRELYKEVFSSLEAGGVFCNLEHVSSPTQRVHDRFLQEMGMTPEDEDPSNKLLDVETQLRWLKEIGFEDVDCNWKWRELALLSGHKTYPGHLQTAKRSGQTKQVLVMRHDLKMRRGKQIAQGSHASMSFICHRLKQRDSFSMDDFSEVEQGWMNGSFAKVCCRVNSKEELIAIHDSAVEANLEVHLITDSGKTEFHGEPTQTCLAIGPDDAEKIDAITGELQLL